MNKPTLTRFEVCQTVLADNARSTDDRAKALALLKRIADDVGDPDCAEAKRLLATLPLSQEQEDKRLEVALAYQPPPLPERRFPSPPLPWAKWNPQMQRLVELLRGAPFLVDPEFYAASLAGREGPPPDYAVKWVADLKALYSRTESDRVRAAVVAQLRRIAKWEWVSDDACRTASRKVLADIGAETN